MSATLVRLCVDRVFTLLSTYLIDTKFGEMFWSLQGAEGDGSTGGSGGSNNSGNEDDEDDSDDDEDDADEDDDPEDEPLDGKSAKKLREEAAKRRRKNRELKGEIARLEKEKEQTSNAGKSETERLQAELDSATSKLEEALARNQESAIKTAFLESNKVTWHDPRTAMKLLDREEIDIDDDGEVSGMADAIEALAKEHPYLVKKSKDDDDEDGGKKRKKTASGSSGEGGTKKKKDSDSVDREGLKKKYPALR